jgi:hypothetical protein
MAHVGHVWTKTSSTVQQLVRKANLDGTTLHQKTLDTAANAIVTTPPVENNPYT